MRRRRWFFGPFSVMADDREDALRIAVYMSTVLAGVVWRSWG